MRNKLLLLSAAAAMAGCTSNLMGTPESNMKLDQRVDKVIDKYFIPSAAEELKEVPVYYGKITGANAASVTHWVAAVWCGLGFNPKIIFNYTNPGVEERTVVHEFIHWSSQMLELFDWKEFADAWGQMQKDPEYSDVIKEIDDFIDKGYGSAVRYTMQYRNEERRAYLEEARSQEAFD